MARKMAKVIKFLMSEMSATAKCIVAGIVLAVSTYALTATPTHAGGWWMAVGAVFALVMMIAFITMAASFFAAVAEGEQ